MGKTCGPITGVKLPLVYREYGIRLESDDHVVSIGFDEEIAKEYEQKGLTVVHRAVGQWE